MPEDSVAAELELAWWRSALDSLLAADRALLGAKTDVLERLEADFRLVDEAHASGSAQLLAWQLAENWKIGSSTGPTRPPRSSGCCKSDGTGSAALQNAAPHLSRAFAPIWLASPYEVPQITDTMPFDTVVLVDAGALTVAESSASIRRAKQLVAFGDPVTQTPAPFELALDEPDPAAEIEPPDARAVDELHARSALAQLSAPAARRSR